MNRVMTVKTLAASSLGLLLLAGCATSLTPSESGTLTGAGLGAAGGAVLGGIAGSAGTGAAIGAGVGAVAGALAGRAIEAEQATRAYPPWYAHAAAPNPSTPPPPPDAALEIEAMPEEAEIIVEHYTPVPQRTHMYGDVEDKVQFVVLGGDLVRGPMSPPELG